MHHGKHTEYVSHFFSREPYQDPGNGKWGEMDGESHNHSWQDVCTLCTQQHNQHTVTTKIPSKIHRFSYVASFVRTEDGQQRGDRCFKAIDDDHLSAVLGKTNKAEK